MTQDEAYENAAYIPGGALYPARWATASAAFRQRAAARARARLDLPYGPGPRNRFDLFLPEGSPAGLVVLIHGGFWRRFGREDFAHLAAGSLGAGWAVAVPSYTLAPEARIPAITAEIAAAVTAAAAEVAGPIALTGHSAGGHLAARMLCGDVALPVRGRLSACVPVSPLADLRPLIDTALNADLRLDDAAARSESPALTKPAAQVPVTVWVGGVERPGFLDQARWLAEAWPRARLRRAEGRHHFDIIAAYEDPDSVLVRDLTALPG